MLDDKVIYFIDMCEFYEYGVNNLVELFIVVDSKVINILLSCMVNVIV